MGAAIQNLLLVAHAIGYGTGLTSGQAMSPPRLARLCTLAEGETAVCCIDIGTVIQPKPPARLGPLPEAFVHTLPAD